MREFTVRIDVLAPVERVWAVMSDVARWPEWTGSVDAVERLDDGPMRAGSRAKVRQPRLPPAVWTVATWEPGRGFVWSSRSPGLTAVGVHSLEPIAGGCAVTLAVRFEGPLAGLVALFWGGLTRRYIELEAAGLKRRSETGA